MAITHVEDPASREHSIGAPASTHRRLYTIHGSSDYGAIIEYLALNSPTLIDLFEGGNNAGLFFLPRVKVDAIPAGMPDIWRGYAEYSSFGPDEFFFEIGGGTEHILVNDRGATAAYAPSGETPENFHGLINYDGESVNGVDIPPGNTAIQFGRKKVFLNTQVTSGYIATLIGFSGYPVNNALFYGCEPGEALFLGCSGRTLGDGTWEFDFRWAASKNRSNIVIRGRRMSDGAAADINVTTKDGWDYLWVRSMEFKGTRDIVKAPVAAYVETLLPRKDFALLQIGTGLP